MKSTKTVLVRAMMIALFSITLISGCKKEEDDTDADWASSLVGAYTYVEMSGGSPITTTVEVLKTGNKSVSIEMERNSGAGYSNHIFPNAVLTTATTCVVAIAEECEIMSPTYTRCEGIDNGSAVFTPNSIHLDYRWYQIVMFPGDTQTYSTHWDFIATK